MSKWAEKTPEEQQAHLAKMAAGRKKKSKTKRGETVLAKSEQSTNGHGPSLESVLRSIDFKAMPVVKLRETVQLVQEFVSTAQRALQAAIQNKSGTQCSVCERPFVNGRFFGQEQWHDHVTGGIAVLRSCSPSCQAKIEQMAAKVKKDALENEHMRFNRP
jgi:hypothetical protein